MQGILTVVSGFSGAGKGTLMKRLISDYDNYALSISMTTRNCREGEVDGKDYFFVTKQQFEDNIAKDGFIEHACYCGNYYGTPREYVESKLKEGKDVVLEIEVQGAMQVKKRYPDALLLFVTPPSVEELERRLRGRGTETDEVIKSRLHRAVEECESMDNYEALVINDDLDKCVKEMNSIIQSAKFATDRNKQLIADIKQQLRDY